MKIVTNLTCPGVAPDNMAYSAVDEDTYDGAPDSAPIARLIGMGPTPEAATADLLEQLEDFDPDWRDHYGTIESAECNLLRAQEYTPVIVSSFEPPEMHAVPYSDPDEE